jgi:hypothetical protein
MATTSYLIKSILHKSLAEGVYRDIVTRKSNYYYMLGKTIPWNTDDAPPYPIDSYEYDRSTRAEAITYKSINASDVSFVVSRTNWQANVVYDMYDDSYSGEVIGLDLVSGGSGYTSLPTVTITGGNGSGASYGAIVDTGSSKIIGVQQKDTLTQNKSRSDHFLKINQKYKLATQQSLPLIVKSRDSIDKRVYNYGIEARYVLALAKYLKG